MRNVDLREAAHDAVGDPVDDGPVGAHPCVAGELLLDLLDGSVRLAAERSSLFQCRIDRAHAALEGLLGAGG